MIKLTWHDQERRQLKETFQTTPDGRLRARCQAMPMAHRGRRHLHIAEDLGVSVRTIQRWLRIDQATRCAGLKSHWVPGRRPRLPEALAPAILTWITQGPPGCGLDRAHWTSAELAAHLYSTHGITVSASTMRAFCPRHGVRPYRPTYRYLTADPVQQETARQESRHDKKAHAGELVVLSQDEARFSMIPSLRTTLGLTGHRPVGGNLDGHDVVAVFGALHLVTGHLTTRIVAHLRVPKEQPKPPSRQRRLQEALARHLRDIARAYPAEQYPRVVLVIDHAPWHKGTLISAVLNEWPQVEWSSVAQL
jgi:transposase